MQNSEINIREIRSLTIKGIAWSYLPFYLMGLSIPWLKTLPELVENLILLPTLIAFIYGFLLCGQAADRYAKYKGYKNYLYIYSFLNVFGLSLLFLLNNKNTLDTSDTDKHPLERFSITTIFTSWFAIPLLFSPIFMLVALNIAGVEGFEEYLKNENFSDITNIPVLIVFVWYFSKEFKRANLNPKLIMGSLKGIDFKLPIGLAIVEFLFAWGANYITMYGLSFIFPKYVENQINHEYATSFIGWICFAIGALFFAPIMEELFYRGIIFQKLTITKKSTQAILISAIAFTVIHFRYDVVSLFIAGILYVLLYLKTKQLIVPIISHFFYNLIVTAANLYQQLFSNTDSSIQTTVAEFQQQFSDRWELYILLVAISLPYLCYFIYKNFPRNYDIEKLPYFANQKIFS